MNILKLKSTGQTVFSLPWSAQAPIPWDNRTYQRVIRLFSMPSRKGNVAETIVVRRDNLISEDA